MLRMLSYNSEKKANIMSDMRIWRFWFSSQSISRTSGETPLSYRPSIKITPDFFTRHHSFNPLRKNPEGQPLSVFFFFLDELSLEKTLQNTGKNWKFLGTNSPTGVLRAIRKRGKSWRFYYSSPHTPHKNMHKKLKKMWFLGRAKVVLFKSHFLVCYGSLAEVIGDCSGLQEATSLPPPFTHHALC